MLGAKVPCPTRAVRANQGGTVFLATLNTNTAARE